MKRTLYILFLLTALLLCACGKENHKDDVNPTTEPTVPTTPSAATDPTVALTPYNTPANVELMPGTTYGNKNFQDFLNKPNWYNRALSCTFENPQDMPMEYLLFNGVTEGLLDNSTFTNEERTFLHGKWCEKYGSTPWVNAVKIPVVKINEALAVLNITAKDVKYPADWVYYDKADAYYAPERPVDSVGAVDVKITRVERISDAVKLYWETDKAYKNTATGEVLPDGAKMVTTLKRHSFNNGYNYFYIIESNIPGEYTALQFGDMNTAEDFTAFIKQEWSCWRAMGCTFENPKDIPLQYYFYMGLEQDESKTYVPLTAEEQAEIDAAYRSKFNRDPYTGESKLPVKEVKEALEVLGVTLEELTIPDEWIYHAKTDSYYFWKSDAYGVVGWSVTRVDKNTDGTVKIYWESTDGIWNTETNRFYPDGTKMVMTLQGKPDGGYLILSNVPVQ